MYSFEWNDNHVYKTREDLADELRNAADYVESGGTVVPSQFYSAPTGWIHRHGTCNDDLLTIDDTDEYDECTDLYNEYDEDDEEY